MQLNKHFLIIFLLIALIPNRGSSQYVPSYLKKPLSQAKKSKIASLNPGRDKLLRTIEKLDSSDLMKNASWGVMVMDAGSGTVIAAHNEKRLLTPASLMKAITTGAGYLQLGSNFRFATKLFYAGEITSDSILKGDLILLASGDPSICCSRWTQTSPESVFDQFTTQIKALGIHKIEGKIVIDQSSFDDMQSSPNWNWGDMGNYFGAGSSALCFNENITHFWLNSSGDVGSLTSIDSIYPKIPNAEYRNYIESASPTSGDNANIFSSATGNIVELRGTIPAGRNSFLLKGANFHPEITFATEFQKYLASNGVETTSEVEYLDFRSKKDTNIVRNLITTYYSPTYNTLASFTNKTSHNMFAEAFLKQMGRQRYGIGSYYTGVRAVDQALAKIGMSQQEFVNVDGSGLSRLNLVSPSFVCKYFRQISRSSAYSNFYNSLSQAGESGTIGWMFKGTAAAHNLRAKSGSIERVRSYGGYVTNKKGRLLTFAIIVNNFNERQNAIVTQLEKLMIDIAESD